MAGEINPNEVSGLPSRLVAAAPPGLIAGYGGPAAPTGWLECNGDAVSREDYSRLFEAIDVAYGPGDGSTTFELPTLTDPDYLYVIKF